MGASSQGSMGVFSLVNGISEASTKRLQGKIQEQIAETNARFSEIQAKDAIERGDEASNEYAGQVRRVIADQKVAFAGQGVEVNSGTAAAIQNETEYFGGVNTRKIKSNAWKEAWGLRAQAEGQRSAGAFAKMGADNEAKNSLITGGMRALDYGVKAYGEYEKKQPAKKGK